MSPQRHKDTRKHAGDGDTEVRDWKSFRPASPNALTSDICILDSGFVRALVSLCLSGRILFLLFLFCGLASAQLQIARLRYGGGGDWYNDPDAISNLAKEVNSRTNIRVSIDEAQVGLLDEKLYQYPFLFMTGHGNISFSDDEVKRLRRFLETGGFLYADDDYGMDESFRREIARVFPNSQLVELGHDHPIYHQVYDFPNGLPKIHEHAEGPPHGYGIFVGGRMVVFYTFNTNISDGWTAAHKDPPEVREQAFRVGINIVSYFLTN